MRFLKILIALLTISTSANFAYGSETDYSRFSSIEEAIQYETTEILRLEHASDHAALSEAYISRAESYLFTNQLEHALADLQKGYKIAGGCKSSDEKCCLSFRSLFGMVIAYNNLGMESTAISISQILMDIIDSMQCDCESQSAYFPRGDNAVQIIPCVVIEGPNQNIPGWCEDVVRGTADAMRFLASLSKKNGVAASLIGIVSALESRCLRCCASGQFWKTCVLPIAEKWKIWDDKYHLLGIPPDPAWD